MSTHDTEEDQALLEAVHYIHSFYNGDISIDFIKQCVENTSRNGTINGY